MHNTVCLIGRLTNTPKIQELENGAKTTTINVAVQRDFKNEKGIYETDFFEVQLWDAIAINTCVYCQKGDLVGIKGRLQNFNYEDENGNKKMKIMVIAEKISYLASKKQDMEEV